MTAAAKMALYRIRPRSQKITEPGMELVPSAIIYPLQTGADAIERVAKIVAPIK